MTTIAAAVSIAPRHTEVRQFPRPDIAADAGLLHVELTGVCGSDWPYYLRYPQSKGPLILGHETVGRIDQVGAIAERRFGVKEGDRVALEEYLPCGHCRWCRSGDFRLCDETDGFVCALCHESSLWRPTISETARRVVSKSLRDTLVEPLTD